MVKKKKKPVSNPARGFATTSIASKKVLLEPAAEDKSETELAQATKENDVEPKKGPGKEKEWHEYTAEDLENAELQSFLDTHGAKIARDAQRQLSKLQTDCRVVRPQAFDVNTFRWLPEDLLTEIIAFAHDEQSHIAASATSKDMTLDDLTTKSWTLLRTLQGFGISDEESFDQLKATPLSNLASENSNYIWGLQESFDRLTRSADQHALPSYDIRHKKPKISALEDNDSSQPSSGAATPARHAGPNAALQENAISTSIDNHAEKVPTPDDGISGATRGHHVAEFEVSELDSDADGDIMQEKYLATQTKLFHISPDLAPAPSIKNKKFHAKSVARSKSLSIRKLQNKIARIEGDILFDKDLALFQWSKLRTGLVKDAAKSRQEVMKSRSSSNSDEDTSSAQAKRTAPITPTTPSDDSDEEAPMAAMFTEPQTVGGDDTTAIVADSAVTVRNFGKMTGLSPKRLLEEACRARYVLYFDYATKEALTQYSDSNVKIQLRQISETTYSCRHAITISWSKSQERVDDEVPPGLTLHQQRSTKDSGRIVTATISMMSVATPDQTQSEAFVATAALFILFANSPRDEKAYLKLGPAWRDLWQEFSDHRKSLQDSIERKTIKQIRDMLRQRQQSEEEDGLVFSAALRQRETNGVANGPRSNVQAPGEFAYPSWLYAQQMWNQRLITPAYQIMLQSRMTLPMFGFREAALSIIQSSQVTILCGETGCGKSTQLPAYIMEDCLARGTECKILCTEPRRISAISLAHRVSAELGEGRNEVGTATSLVGYAVRLETKIGALTRLIYATVGVVLRMLESSGDLSEYTHLIIDEVHERSIETDFLLVILKGIMVRRPELKVILMSATVDSARFSAYLNDAPVIEVPGRTFPVNAYFLEDALEVSHHGVGKRQSFQRSNHDEDEDDSDQGVSGISKELAGYSQTTRDVLAEYDEYRIDYELIVSLMETIVTKDEFLPYSKAILVFLPGIGEIRELNDMLAGHSAFNGRIYPLHSSISSEEQQSAFDIPPPGQMKIVLSTNIAETGVTIPDVTCVIDTGKHKEMRFDEKRQLSRLVQAFISQANAKQRRGRAGRVQEGICFHLLTKKRHDELLAPQQTPEMLRLSLQDLAMRVKIAGLGDIEETLGRALDPPSSKNIRRAIDQLIEVGALTKGEELTPLGRQLAKLPLDAHLGKLCLLSAIFGCLDAGLTMAAILSSKSPFLTPFGARQQADIARLAFSRGDSDLLTVYNAYCAWKRVSEKPNENVFAFCRKNFLSPQIMRNIEDLKAQIIASMIDTGLLHREQATSMRSRGKHAFVKVPQEHDENSSNDIITSSVISWAFYPKLLLRDGKGFRSVANSQPISLHPTSVNKGNNKLNYLSYYSIMQSGNKFYHNTNANSTTIAYEVPLMVLAGEADFKLHAGVISIDSNRLKFKVKDWRTTYALKMMRLRLTELVEYRIKHPAKQVSEELLWWKHAFERVCAALAKDN